MYLNSHVRKIFNRATVLASSACLAMAVAPVAVHAGAYPLREFVWS